MDRKISAGEHNMGKILDTGLFSKEQTDDLFIFAAHCKEGEQVKNFNAMADSIVYGLTRKLKIISKLVWLLFMLLTGAGVFWVYFGAIMLGSAMGGI